MIQKQCPVRTYEKNIKQKLTKLSSKIAYVMAFEKYWRLSKWEEKYNQKQENIKYYKDIKYLQINIQHNKNPNQNFTSFSKIWVMQNWLYKNSWNTKKMPYEIYIYNWKYCYFF